VKDKIRAVSGTETVQFFELARIMHRRSAKCRSCALRKVRTKYWVVQFCLKKGRQINPYPANVENMVSS